MQLTYKSFEDDVNESKDFEYAVDKIFGPKTAEIKSKILCTVEEQKNTKVEITIDQLIRLWNAGVEAGIEGGKL